MQNKPALSCVCVLPAVICALKRQAASLTLGKEKRPKSNYIMKKGKALTVLVLVLEIASITILHAVKINQSEKAAAKEVSRSASEVVGSRPKAVYSLAVFK
jgi:hypothetical protein